MNLTNSKLYFEVDLYYDKKKKKKLLIRNA